MSDRCNLPAVVRAVQFWTAFRMIVPIIEKIHMMLERKVVGLRFASLIYLHRLFPTMNLLAAGF